MHPTRIMTLVPSLLLSVIVVSACSSGPTSRSTDGKWKVSENICSSDPARPELGDMRSDIRQYVSGGTSGKRKISFFYKDRTIFETTESFNYRTRTGDIKLYENSVENPLLETRLLRNNTEVNKAIDKAVDEFFKNDPDVNAQDAQSFCLFRGQ